MAGRPQCVTTPVMPKDLAGHAIRVLVHGNRYKPLHEGSASVFGGKQLVQVTVIRS